MVKMKTRCMIDMQKDFINNNSIFLKHWEEEEIIEYVNHPTLTGEERWVGKKRRYRFNTQSC
jgi:hypothetical protein